MGIINRYRAVSVSVTSITDLKKMQINMITSFQKSMEQKRKVQFWKEAPRSAWKKRESQKS